MENKSNIKVISLNELWEILIQRLWIILLVAVLTVAVVYAGITLTFVPRYESVATLYILQQSNTNQNVDNTNYEGFNLALKVVNDCTHLMKSHSVLDNVIKDLSLNISYKDLYESISITNPTDTRILEVAVESDTPLNAKMIVDKICSIGTAKITDAMGFEQVNFYEKGVLDMKPCNTTSVSVYLAIGLAAAALTYLVFFMQYILDDKIYTDEDIEKYLKLSILGDIPCSDATDKKRYGYKYYRRNKYYGKQYGEEK